MTSEGDTGENEVLGSENLDSSSRNSLRGTIMLIFSLLRH
jgi:hypothetical protein